MKEQKLGVCIFTNHLKIQDSRAYINNVYINY